MTWLIFLLGAIAAAAFFTAGRIVGRAGIESRSYWQGFADGELHQQLNDRAPSPN